MTTSKALHSITLALLLLLVPSNLFAGENERLFQVGLFPPLSSNGLNSGKTVNTISLNLIGGYSGGSKAFELGSVWNASRGYTRGVQIAGLLNVADTVCGLQLSSLVNVAGRVRGVQLGLINYVSDGESGVSIGLINIAARGGKYEFEVSFSESLNCLIAFRLGTDRFYTIFSGGMNCCGPSAEHALGLGFGTSIGWKNRWSSQIEILAFGVSHEKKLFRQQSTNSIIQLRLPVCKEFARHFKAFIGPTINLGLQSAAAEDAALSRWVMWHRDLKSLKASGWVGLSAGLRF